MKIQTELRPMSEIPEKNGYPHDENIIIYVWRPSRHLIAYRFYNKDILINWDNQHTTWEELKTSRGWMYDRFIQLEEEQKEPEKLTIADLIKEAKEEGFKYIAQDQNTSIYFYKTKVNPSAICFIHSEKDVVKTNLKSKGALKVKKWYEGDWKNSLIEVK